MIAVPALLDRELYDLKVASTVLRVPESTLHRWLEGGERRGSVYPPVLRPKPTGSRVMRWGEVVEAGFLAGYRRKLRVRLGDLRRFIELLRESLDTPYPLAMARPWVGVGRKLLVSAGTEAELPGDLLPGLIEPTTGQLVLAGVADRFLARVEFDPPGDPAGSVARIRPAGPSSPVVIDPAVRFGVPTVEGISTEILWRKWDAGEPVEVLADAYDLDRQQVISALEYEREGSPLSLAA